MYYENYINNNTNIYGKWNNRIINGTGLDAYKADDCYTANLRS